MKKSDDDGRQRHRPQLLAVDPVTRDPPLLSQHHSDRAHWHEHEHEREYGHAHVASEKENLDQMMVGTEDENERSDGKVDQRMDHQMLPSSPSLDHSQRDSYGEVAAS